MVAKSAFRTTTLGSFSRTAVVVGFMPGFPVVPVNRRTSPVQKVSPHSSRFPGADSLGQIPWARFLGPDSLADSLGQIPWGRFLGASSQRPIAAPAGPAADRGRLIIPRSVSQRPYPRTAIPGRIGKNPQRLPHKTAVRTAVQKGMQKRSDAEKSQTGGRVLRTSPWARAATELFTLLFALGGVSAARISVAYAPRRPGNCARYAALQQ